MKNSVSFNSNLSRFGIGVFETIKVTDRPLYLEYHLNRAFNSIFELDIITKVRKEDLRKYILDYIKDNNIQNKALRVTIFDEGYNLSTRDIIYDENSYRKGFDLTISPIKRGKSILNYHKTTNYFENIYSKNYASKNNFDDSIFIDYKGNILECSFSNIFFIKDKTIVTPDKSLPILNGITRKRVISFCIGKFDIIYENINIEDIKRFDFCFITNSLMGCMRVNKIDDHFFERKNEIFEIIKENIN